MKRTMDDAAQGLLILYTLKISKIPLTRYDLSIIMMDSLLMNYMTFTQVMASLVDNKYIIKDGSGKNEFLEISEEGNNILNILEKDLEESKKEIIKEYLFERGNEIKENNALEASYQRIDKESFRVNIKAFENRRRIFSLNLEVSDEKTAKNITENWKKKSHKIYPDILGSLLNGFNKEK